MQEKTKAAKKGHARTTHVRAHGGLKTAHFKCTKLRLNHPADLQPHARRSKPSFTRIMNKITLKENNTALVWQSESVIFLLAGATSSHMASYKKKM